MTNTYKFSFPSFVRDEFNKKFNNEHDIAKPIEVNGLHKINIYREQLIYQFINQLSIKNVLFKYINLIS